MSQSVHMRLINKSVGFSLIELIVVLLIMTTMMAVAAPRVAGRSEAAILRSAAADFQTLAAAARAKAVLQQRTITLKVDNSSIGLFALVAGSDAGGTNSNIGSTRQTPKANGSENAATDEAVSRSRKLAEGLVARFESDEREDNLVSFFPDGSSDQGKLVIVNARDEQMVLTLSAATGRLRLAE